MFDKEMVAVDGSEHALRAVDAAAVIAQRCGSELIVLTVLESLKVSPEVQQFAASEREKAPATSPHAPTRQGPTEKPSASSRPP